jgi:hypothetical protein
MHDAVDPKENEMFRKHRIPVALAGAVVSAAVFAAVAVGDAPPVGPLPSGPTSTIQTQKGQLVAFALPRRTSGRVWRVARKFDAGVVKQVSEAEVGSGVVVVVFRAVDRGTTTVAFGLTRGETAKAFESRRYVVRVR